MKTLYFDIETSPAVAATFSLWKPTISMDQIIEHPFVLGVSYRWDTMKRAKWIGWNPTSGQDEYRKMLQEVHQLLDEADVLVGYNSVSFDKPWLEGELIVHGFTPPSPSRHVDLYRELKKHSRFISRKLDYAALRLLDNRKVKHEGITLWLKCMAGDKKALAEMKRYALKDTDLLVPLYEIIRPWMNTVPNIGIADSIDELVCPACGSENHQRRGHYDTNAGRYQRYQCQDCFKWFRGVARVSTTPGRPI